MSDLGILRTLEGATIVKTAEYQQGDSFYLKLSDGRVIYVWAMDTNVSTGFTIVEEVNPKTLSKKVRAELEIGP